MSQRTLRLRRAGSAYLEALVLLPLFIVILLCALALGRSYEARLLAGQRAREAAWREAGRGCGQPTGSTTERLRALAHDRGRDPLSSLTATFLGAVTLERHAGEATASAPLLGDEARGFRTVTQFACNEVPPAPSQVAGERPDARGMVERLAPRGMP